MYKVSNILDSINTIKELLLLEEALFRFDVVAEGADMLLTIQKESQKFEYRTYGVAKYKEMENFLVKLREAVPVTLKEDIDFVLEDMNEALNYSSKY